MGGICEFSVGQSSIPFKVSIVVGVSKVRLMFARWSSGKSASSGCYLGLQIDVRSVRHHCCFTTIAEQTGWSDAYFAGLDRKRSKSFGLIKCCLDLIDNRGRLHSLRVQMVARLVVFEGVAVGG